jgi:hypothetical protein
VTLSLVVTPDPRSLVGDAARPYGSLPTCKPWRRISINSGRRTPLVVAFSTARKSHLRVEAI